MTCFGSIEAVRRANADPLVSVEGIGTVTAEAIRWVLLDSTPATEEDSPLDGKDCYTESI